MSAWDYFADSGNEFINRRMVLLCQNNWLGLVLANSMIFVD